MAVFRLNQSHLGKIQSEVPPTLTHQATTSNCKKDQLQSQRGTIRAKVNKNGVITS